MVLGLRHFLRTITQNRSIGGRKTGNEQKSKVLGIKKAPKRDIQTRFVRLLQQKQRYLRGLSKYKIADLYRFVKQQKREKMPDGV